MKSTGQWTRIGMVTRREEGGSSGQDEAERPGEFSRGGGNLSRR